MDNNMKAEINNENKAKFFALYWGQKVYRKPEVPGFESTVGGFISDERVPKTGYLELKSLSDIGDEDAIECAKIIDPDKKHGDWEQAVAIKYVFNEIFNPQLDESIDDITPFQFTYMYDFLRSRGYLLPWMGLSCEELIESGWAKYKE